MANYYLFHGTVAALEGGYQNSTSDKKGNTNSRGEMVGTNYGVSAPVYEKWIGYPPSIANMKAITPTVAKEIFKANYWNKLQASFINSQAVAETLVDHGINAGIVSAAKIIQKVLNDDFNKKLSVDGGIGSKTLAAINSVNATDLFQSYNAARIDFYNNLGKPHWINGWIKRVQTISDKFGIVLKKKQ
jgi:lysozyme family protein